MADIKQYVNVDPASAAQRQGIAAARAGRTIHLTATIDPAQQNVMLSVEIVPGANNVKRTDIDAGIFDERCAETGRKRALTNEQGQATVDFDLSLFGGDEFTFKVRRVVEGAEQDPALDHPDKYIVWKRVYYQVTRFASGPKGAGRAGGNLPEVADRDLGNAVTEIAARRHNIELVEQDPTTEVITRRGNVIDISTHQRAFQQAAREGFDASRAPLAIKVVLVNQMAVPAVRNITFSDVMASANAVTRVTRTLPTNLWVDESAPLDEDWFVSAQWAWSTGINPFWSSLDRANVRAVAPNKVELALPAVSTTDRVSIYLEYRTLQSGGPGLTDQNTIWLATTDMGTQSSAGPSAPTAIPAAKFDLVAIHELGHVLGMVPIWQSTWYERHGHSGEHCSTGLSADDRRAASYFGKGGTCVMFGGPSTPPDAQQPVFCAVCDFTMRARQANGLRMPDGW